MQDEKEALENEQAAAEAMAEEAVETEQAEPDLESVMAERDEYHDRMMRAFADLENLRKRAERDRRDAERYGGTKLARDLLDVYDNMDRALATVTDELRDQAAGLVDGIELTQHELLKAFEKHNIQKIEPALGEKFDPSQHQAMFEAPVPNTVRGTVIQVTLAGFTIGDRLLRAAQVGVSSNTQPVEAKPEEEGAA